MKNLAHKLQVLMSLEVDSSWVEVGIWVTAHLVVLDDIFQPTYQNGSHSGSNRGAGTSWFTKGQFHKIKIGLAR